VQITHKVIWPLFLFPLALLNQLVAPHPIWIVLSVMLAGMYGFGIFWVRTLAQHVRVKRARIGSVLIAGDSLREEFELHNTSALAVLWVEFIDHSTVPGYEAGQVVGCGPATSYRWYRSVVCRQRGVYQLGPHELSLGDPLGLFRLDMSFEHHDLVLIYPRVARLPLVSLPTGDASGAARRRRPLWGALPSASVRTYQPTDSLRYIHWPNTAHRGELMVKELEIEPSGAVWIVLDLNVAVHQGEDEQSTLEFAVVLAASLAAELLGGSERRAVGLFTVSGEGQPRMAISPNEMEDDAISAFSATSTVQNRAVVMAPQTGPAQMWRLLAALAAVQASTVPLVDLLRGGHVTLGRRGTLVLISPQLVARLSAEDWSAELIHLHSLGLGCSVLGVLGVEEPDEGSESLRSQLARYAIPLQIMRTGTRLPAALTFRRTRKVVRSTPRGGVVTYEVEEEVA
jgi:uncharacterized protein (DUF58 family)